MKRNPADARYSTSNYRWYILALTAISGTFVAAIPFSCMPVLFEEISQDLGLNLVQIGTIWGITSLAGVFISLIGGLLSDRFGMKSVLTISCLLVGITGALRGLSDSFFTLTLTVFLNGIARTIVPINLTKTIGIWFRGRNLGMANGIASAGMGLGLMLGPMVSATVLSPLLGSWRNVMFFYGAISIAVALLWFLFGREPGVSDPAASLSGKVTFKEAVSKLIKVKNVWFIALTLMFRMACIIGMTGYLPLYLRGQGWASASADNTLAAFYAASTLSTIPMSLLSDRLGLRKAILLPALVVTTISLVLLPVVEGTTIIILMILSGIFMDSFMAIIIAQLLETEGVRSLYSGTALGIVFTISQIGGIISPPLGNSLASISPGLPFIFWSALSATSLVTLAFAEETG